MVHVPVATKVMVKPETVQTPVVPDVRVTEFPVAFVVGATVSEPVESDWSAGWAYVMVCVPRGVTDDDEPDAELVPPALDAVAVNV